MYQAGLGFAGLGLVRMKKPSPHGGLELGLGLVEDKALNGQGLQMSQ